MPIEPLRIENVDLTRHAVIEAAAGTGKTYTIEHLVCRCIVERGFDIASILVVTFTEKATGEMQERIRMNIENALARTTDPPVMLRLQQALDGFDRASIMTIHSFCNGVLRQFAFENRQPFSVKLCTDPEIAELLFDELLRGSWAAMIARFPEGLRREIQKDNFGKSIIIAMALRIGTGDIVLPHVTTDLDNLSDTSPPALFYSLAAHRLSDRMSEYKAERGLISYNDMIRLLDRAIGDETSPNALLEVIRTQYRMALVDEFQDTDPIQWSIFRKIFACSPTHVLMVIGDPKQAIYGFRGADVTTYRLACQEMIKQRGAIRYCLRINWRSLPVLIDDFNRLFEYSGWFNDDLNAGDDNTVIVSAPDDAKRKTRLYLDRSGRAATTIVDLREYTSSESAMRRFAVFVADEITRLLGDATLVFSDGKSARYLNAGDICILVRKRDEAVGIEAELDRRSIPHSFYKKSGVYQSDEAMRFCAILEMLACDDAGALRKALLSPFFGVSPQTLDSFDDLDPAHPIKNLISRWRMDACRRNWPGLLNSMVYDSDILIDAVEHSGSDRAIATCLQIVEDLQTIAVQKNMDILSLWRHLTFRIHESIEEDEQTTLHRLETESPVVRIMTMHTSKGLQFPVVFMAGGFGRGGNSKFWKYHDDQNRPTLNLNKDDAAGKKAHAREQTEDNQRIFYVSLTRAMIKLYLPGFIRRTKRGAPHGSSGMISTLLFPAIEQSLSASGIGSIPPLDGTVSCFPYSIEDTIIESMPSKITPRDLVSEGELLDHSSLFPSVPFVADRKAERWSFSALRHRDPLQSAERTRFDDTSKDADEPVSDGIPDEIEAIPGDLPAGEKTGQMFHELFETIDFEITEDDSNHIPPDSGLVRRLLRKYGIDSGSSGSAQGTVDRVKRTMDIVSKTLATPLPPYDIRLRQIARSDRLSELEFLLSMDARIEQYMHGFVDLVFRQCVAGQEMLFILDWKSNRLDRYDAESIMSCMDAENYHLQYAVYTLSLARWMRSINPPDWSFDAHFGGVYYLFLRGLNGVDSSQGVFHCVPRVEECEEMVARALIPGRSRSIS